MTALAVRHTRRTDDVARHALETLDSAGEGVSGAGARMRERVGVWGEELTETRLLNVTAR